MRLKGMLLSLSIIALASCGNSGGTKSTAEARKVKWSVVQSYSAQQNNFTFSGKVEPANDVNLSFRVAGVVESVAGKSGTFVKKGATIAQLDRRDYIEQLAATQAEWDAVSGEANRVIALYQMQSVSQNDYNKAVSGLKQITAKLNAHRNALEDTRLVAPFDGYIQRLNFDAKETIGAGVPIVQFVASDKMEIVVNIPYDNYIQRDKFISAVATSPQFAGEEYTLDLLGINPKANLNQLYMARFAIKECSVVNEQRSVAAGMSVVVNMNYQSDNHTSVVLPLSAVVERDGCSYVWALREDNSVELREANIIEIKKSGDVVLWGGVAAGERVVTAGVGSLKEGEKVMPMAQVSETNVGAVL